VRGASQVTGNIPLYKCRDLEIRRALGIHHPEFVRHVTQPFLIVINALYANDKNFEIQ